MKYIVPFLILFFASCSVSKKDIAALDRVSAKKSLLDALRPQIMELYPCANDTIERWFSGGTDTLTIPINVVDTLYYIEPTKEPKAKIKYIKVPVKKADTIVRYIVDRTKDEMNNQQIIASKIKMEEQQKIIQAYVKKLRWGVLWIILLIIAMTSCCLLRILNKFR